MGAEIKNKLTSKVAPHRQYLPLDQTTRGRASENHRDWGLYLGEPEACRRQLLPFARSMAHLGILLAVFKVYRIEGRAFLALATLVLIAFPVHYLAPYHWKKALFAAASIVGMYWVFGMEVAAIILGLSTILIGVCYLPASWTARAVGLAALGAALAAARSQNLIPLIPSTVWPVLATMFMFRLLIYMYELKHARSREGLIDTISYFFLLPNFCFPHFPVVDYRTMQRGYFASDIHAIQRRGVRMMHRATLHLLCYRLIYHELLVPAAQVRGPWSLAGYLVCNYLLYLRVSGQFHMACGMLHLFGYQLPDTHHHYILATGFTDYWRRINIYWKDFMVRLVFNPVVFRLKRWPQPSALAVATLTVFLATWLLHAYQSFWLRGTWGFSLPDALFWGVLGVLVLDNVQRDARRSHNRSKARVRMSDVGLRRVEMHPFAIRGLKTAATFTTIAILWSLWSSPSLAAWLDLMHRGILGV
jgi:hypothetical protein